MADAPLDNLSVSIVCKDSASTIGRTLDSVRGLVGGEGGIVAVDSGSTDGTIALLEAAGARIVRTAWMGHVKTKQFALEQCTREWILCIDSDESVQPGLADLIREACSNDFAVSKSRLVDGYEIRRVTYYKESPLRHAWQPEWRIRLVRRTKARWGGFDPHDKLEMIGNARTSRLIDQTRRAMVDGVLRHDSFPTFAEHMRKQWFHATTMAGSLHNAGVRGSYLRLLGSPTGAMLKQLVLKRGVLDGYPGWLAAASTAVAAMIKHATLIELDHEQDVSPQRPETGATNHG